MAKQNINSDKVVYKTINYKKIKYAFSRIFKALYSLFMLICFRLRKVHYFLCTVAKVQHNPHSSCNKVIIQSHNA